eukprot:357411-Chlamydomonas_euryale.AAC.1
MAAPLLGPYPKLGPWWRVKAGAAMHQQGEEGRGSGKLKMRMLARHGVCLDPGWWRQGLAPTICAGLAPTIFEASSARRLHDMWQAGVFCARLQDAGSRVLLTCSGVRRATKMIKLKEIADDACEQAKGMGHTVRWGVGVAERRRLLPAGPVGQGPGSHRDSVGMGGGVILGRPAGQADTLAQQACTQP